jgi:deazaflavin-dependent oxidoreductase (nitroreductase family)
MVLRTVGRRTGRTRSTPVLYRRHGDALLVLAANAGADRTPAWWLNLRDVGTATAIVGRRQTAVHHRVLTGAERDRAWRAYVEMYPQAQFYGQFTRRVLPLIALEETSG